MLSSQTQGPFSHCFQWLRFPQAVGSVTILGRIAAITSPQLGQDKIRKEGDP
jgi:hypothetical protein